MNTAIYILRALQVGLSIEDIEQLSVGMVYDILTEYGNDSCEYDQKATQADFDKF